MELGEIPPNRRREETEEKRKRKATSLETDGDSL